MKDILIISCGPGLEKVRNKFGHAIDWIQRDIDINKFNFIIKDVYKNDIPSYNIGDAWIITGSEFSVYDNLDWLNNFKIKLLEAINMKKPILGICFGHQLLADVLGGAVKKNNLGWEV